LVFGTGVDLMLLALTPTSEQEHDDLMVSSM